LSLRGDPELLQKHLQNVMDLENSVKDLKAEIKFLNEKINILNKENQNQKEMREKDNIFLNEELMYSQNMAVNARGELASVVFDKDALISQLKTQNKKLKTKLISVSGGLSNCPTNLTLTGSSSGSKK
jgi:hypothetical protein